MGGSSRRHQHRARSSHYRQQQANINGNKPCGWSTYRPVPLGRTAAAADRSSPRRRNSPLKCGEVSRTMRSPGDAVQDRFQIVEGHPWGTASSIDNRLVGNRASATPDVEQATQRRRFGVLAGAACSGSTGTRRKQRGYYRPGLTDLGQSDDPAY
jgi:hypothetical protein